MQEEGRNNFTYMDRVKERQQVEDAENVDLTAGIHGNWTIENAKSRLNQFFQAQRIQVGDYKYTVVGPDHNKWDFIYSSEMYFYILLKCIFYIPLST